MDKIKFWVNACLKLALILLAGYAIYSWNGHKTGTSTDAEALKKIDSLENFNYELRITNEKLKTEITSYETEISNLNIRLGNIKPVYVQTIKEYNSSSKEKKSEFVKTEYEKRVKERQAEE